MSRVRYLTQGFEDIVSILPFDEISSFFLHSPDCVWISSNYDILKPLCGITDGGDNTRYLGGPLSSNDNSWGDQVIFNIHLRGGEGI